MLARSRWPWCGFIALARARRPSHEPRTDASLEQRDTSLWQTKNHTAIEVTDTEVNRRPVCDLRASLLQGWCEQQHSALSSWRRRLRLSLLRRQHRPSPRGKAFWSPMAARNGVVTKQRREDDARGCPHRSQRIGFCSRAHFDQSPRIPDIGRRARSWLAARQPARRRRGRREHERRRTHTHDQPTTTQVELIRSRRSARPSRSSRRRSY